MENKNIVLGKSLNLDQVNSFIQDPKIKALLPDTESFKDSINNGFNFLMNAINSGADVYGATTGFGSSSANRLSFEEAEDLQVNLMNFHGCGVGEKLTYEQSLAVLLLRTHCLSLGRSSVTFDLLEKMEEMLRLRVAPVIPSKGSVGASGDLTPLSYLAAMLCGKRKLETLNEVHDSNLYFTNNNITPYKMKAKETLAIMNGTTVMTAIAALAHRKVYKVVNEFCKLTGLIVELIDGRTSPFLPELHAVKPHPGQIKAAERILSYVNSTKDRVNKGASSDVADVFDGSIQDVYSIRCSPQVIGVLYDLLDWSESVINIEINSTTDNPVVNIEKELIMNGGHFFGSHIAVACDSLKSSLYNVVNLADRQMAYLMSAKVKGKIPENLVSKADLNNKSHIHHGFKAMQVTMSALAAEMQKMAGPMSIYSRSTESANQDVTSMGTHAALDLDKLVNLAEYSATILAMAVRQCFYLKKQAVSDLKLNDKAESYLSFLESKFNSVKEDRPMDSEIEQLKSNLFGMNND